MGKSKKIVFQDIFKAGDGTLNTDEIGITTPWVCNKNNNAVFYKKTGNLVYLYGLKPAKLENGELVAVTK